MTLYELLQTINTDSIIHVFLDLPVPTPSKYEELYQKRFSLYKGSVNKIRDNQSLKCLEVLRYDTTKIEPITFVLVGLSEKEEVSNIAKDNPRR